MAEKIAVDLSSLGLESNLYKITVKATSNSYATSEAGLLNVDARYGLFNAQSKLVATWDNLISTHSIRMQYDPKLSYSDRMYCTDETVIVDNGELADRHPKQIIDSLYNTTTTIIIPETVSVIPRYAFWNMGALTKIVIPKSVVTIGDNAFKGCTALTEVYYEGTIEDWCKINFASAGSNPCFQSNAQTIKIKNTLSYSDVTELVIPDGVTKIPAYAFFGFDGLVSAILPGSLEEVGKAAFHLNKYRKFTRQRGYKTTFDIFFQGTVDQWNNITFADPTANPQFLGLLHFWKASDSDAFDTISSIGIDLVNVDHEVEAIGKWQFTDSEDLSVINLPKTLKVADRHAFYRCNPISINFSGNIKEWCNIRFLDLYANPLMNSTDDGTASSRKILTFNYDSNPQAFDSVLAIPEGVQCIHYAQFANFDTQKIIFPSTLKSIRNHAFAFCHNTDTYDFRFVKQVPKLSDMFKASDGYDGRHGRHYTTTFQGIVDVVDRKARQILVPASLYSEYKADATWAALDDYHERITQEPLLIPSEVEEATSITINADAGTYFDLYATYFPGLSLIDWGDGNVTNAIDHCEHYYDQAGTYKIKLYGVNFIDVEAFSSEGGCYNNDLITAAYINPEVTSIEYRAFANCNNLKSVTLTNGLKIIENEAFYGCDELASLKIPATVNYIGDSLCYMNHFETIEFEDPYGWQEITQNGTKSMDDIFVDPAETAYYMSISYQSTWQKASYTVVEKTFAAIATTDSIPLSFTIEDGKAAGSIDAYVGRGSFEAPGEVISASITDALLGDGIPVANRVSISGNTVSYQIYGPKANATVRATIKYKYKVPK